MIGIAQRPVERQAIYQATVTTALVRYLCLIEMAEVAAAPGIAPRTPASDTGAVRIVKRCKGVAREGSAPLAPGAGRT